MSDKPETKPGPVEETPPSRERPAFDLVMGDLAAHLEENPELRKSLRENRIVAGIAGEIADSIYQRRRQDDDREAAGKTLEAERERRLQLAKDDPEAFAELWTKEELDAVAQRDLQNVAYNERKLIADHIGHAFDDLPDGPLSREELAEVAQALAGVPDERVIAVYAAKRTDIIARRRAEQLAEARVNDRLHAEREAWSTEEAAKRAKTTPAPTLRSGTTSGGDSDEPDFRKNPQAWNAWYEKQRR